MEEHSSKNGIITYSKQGDYYLPNLTMPPQDDRPIGIWGERRKHFLLQHYREKIIIFLLLVKLWSILQILMKLDTCNLRYNMI